MSTDRGPGGERIPDGDPNARPGARSVPTLTTIIIGSALFLLISACGVTFAIADFRRTWPVAVLCVLLLYLLGRSGARRLKLRNAAKNKARIEELKALLDGRRRRQELPNPTEESRKKGRE